jgi:hypothetical protein
MAAIDPERYKKYTHFRSVADPLADAAVAAFTEMPAGAARKLFDTALNAGIDSVDDPPAPVVELFKQLDTVPFWVDWDRVDRGGAAFLRSGALGVAVLNLFSMPIMYSSAGGTKPLVFTGDLLRRAPRRLAETARFVLATSRPGGLRRFAEGFKISVRVRMMHAQVRRLLRTSGQWKPEWGEPVNQLYMAGTNVALSVGLLEGMQRLGFHVSHGDSEALLHLWRYSGYLSGVDPELSISTRNEGRLIGELIRDGEGSPDDDCRALIVALMTAAYHPRLQGAKWPAKISYGISRKLIGDELADALGYPPSRWSWALYAVWPLLASASVAQRVLPGSRGLATKLGTWFWNQMIDQAMAGAQAEFRPPAKLGNLAAKQKQQ